MPKSARWGVFTLGNDAVLDWLLACFESVRTYAPECALHMIPFDGHIDRVRPLLDAYGVELYAPSELAAWDRLGEFLYPEDLRSARCFRKLAAFGAAFDFHLFCDADVVALAPFEPLFEAVSDRVPDLVYFDRDIEQVYRPGPLRREHERPGLAQGFNSGIYCGRGGALTVASFAALVAERGPGWRSELAPTAEQPFLNLYADRHELRRLGQWELLPEHCSTAWAAAGEFREEDSAWRLRGTRRWDEGWRLLFAHWAGFSLERPLPNRALFDLLRSRGAARLRGAAGDLVALPRQ